jgi:hypothetical protein
MSFLYDVIGPEGTSDVNVSSREPNVSVDGGFEIPFLEALLFRNSSTGLESFVPSFVIIFFMSFSSATAISFPDIRPSLVSAHVFDESFSLDWSSARLPARLNAHLSRLKLT